MALFLHTVITVLQGRVREQLFGALRAAIALGCCLWIFPAFWA